MNDAFSCCLMDPDFRASFSLELVVEVSHALNGLGRMKDQGGWRRRDHPSLFHPCVVVGNINQREVLAANF